MTLRKGKKNGLVKLLSKLSARKSLLPRYQEAPPHNTSPAATARALSDRLPYDLLLILIDHLVASNSWETLANLAQTSKTNYDIIVPHLHHTRTLNTGALTVPFILLDDPAPIEALALLSRRGGSYFTALAWTTRQRANLQWTKHLVVDRIPPPPDPPAYPTPKHPWPLESVTILPPVMDELTRSFPLSTSTDLLRPLSQGFIPTTLILRQTCTDGMPKHLLHLLDELRWPTLRYLEIHGVGADVLPGRPGLCTTVNFRTVTPASWEVGESVPPASRMRRYSHLRLSQIVTCIARSARLRDGPQSLGPTRWTFVGPTRFYAELADVEESIQRLRVEVSAWIEREYGSMGWSAEGFEELAKRIELVP